MAGEKSGACCQRAAFDGFGVGLTPLSASFAFMNPSARAPAGCCLPSFSCSSVAPRCGLSATPCCPIARPYAGWHLPGRHENSRRLLRKGPGSRSGLFGGGGAGLGHGRGSCLAPVFGAGGAACAGWHHRHGPHAGHLPGLRAHHCQPAMLCRAARARGGALPVLTAGARAIAVLLATRRLVPGAVVG